MDNKISKINWLNIIDNYEFQAVLGIKSIKEMSLLSKQVRERLKPILFENVVLSAYNFNFVDNFKLKSFFIKLFRVGLFSPISTEIATLRKDLSVVEGMKDINCDLLIFKSFVKSLYLRDVGRGGFNLFPMVYKFNNLSALKLKSCSIPFSQIANIGSKLPNLRNIMLECVYFIKSHSDSISQNEFILPANLYQLEINFCKVMNIEELSDPYEFIFSKEFLHTTQNEFKLTNILVPSLKKLTFIYDSYDDCGLENFLEFHPNLEALSIEYFYPNLIKSLNSIKSLEFKYLEAFDINASYLAVNSITHLRINAAYEHYFKKIKKLCLLLPNLEYLYFNVCYEYSFQKTVCRFIIPVLANLTKMKTLEFVIDYNWYVDSDLISDDGSQDDFTNDENIYLSEFPNIDTLILNCNSETIYNLNFKNCITLKQIKLSSIEVIDVAELRDKFDDFRNWKFNFNNHIIRGHNTII